MVCNENLVAYLLIAVYYSPVMSKFAKLSFTFVVYRNLRNIFLLKPSLRTLTRSYQQPRIFPLDHLKQQQRAVLTCHQLFTTKSRSFSNQSNQANMESSKVEKIIWPPAKVIDMKTLDRELFRKPIQVPYVLLNTDKMNTTSKALKPFFLKMHGFKPVQPCPEQKGRHRIYLDPDLFNDETTSKIESLESSLISVNKCDDDSVDKYLGYHDLELTYENYSYHDILRAILPEDGESISGYSIIGHILHLNLRDQAIPFKHLIGQVRNDEFALNSK